MKSYNLEWNDWKGRLKEIVESYTEVRKVYLDDMDKINLILKEDISDDKYHIYDTYLDDVKFVIKGLTVENNKILNMVIFLLSNNHLNMADIYYDIRWSNDKGYPSTYYTMYYNLDMQNDFFYDDITGIIKDYSRCMSNKNFMMSDIYKLGEISHIDIKDNDVYLYGHKYMSKKEFDKYSNKFFEEMTDGVIKNRKYYTIRHYGPYDQIYKTYDKIMNKIKEHKQKINGIPMECFIAGRWNKDSEYEYVTNIMIPVE